MLEMFVRFKYIYNEKREEKNENKLQHASNEIKRMNTKWNITSLALSFSYVWAISMLRVFGYLAGFVPRKLFTRTHNMMINFCVENETN